MLPQPPAPTLFPYTTLFRSGGGDVAQNGHMREQIEALEHDADVRARSGNVALGQPPAATVGDDAIADRFAVDRKSTRLNSSHLGISYAVFCLKKKKKK